MSNERFDVVLRALNGPLASMGEQKFQGPLVRIGTNPGPGGMALTGYRGIDARQCVITAYGEGEATVGPVGNNQVRMAPHPNVKWKDIDPLTQPEYLNEGCAIHLGPVGRGCTIQFIKVEKLGVWTAGRVGSATSNVSAVQVSAPVAGAKKATRNRGAARIRTAGLGAGIVGCLGLSTATVAGVLVIVGVYGFGLLDAKHERLGPVEPGEEFYESVSIEKKSDLDEKTLDGLAEGYRRFVAKPSALNAKAHGRSDIDMITDPELWDERAFKYVVASIEKHVKSQRFFRRLDDIHEYYGTVITQLREAGLPEVIAATPYTESRYRPDLQSWACAKGFWQFMPEVANRINKKNGVNFQVRDCKLRKADGSNFLWTPERLSPPNGIMKNAPYIDKTSGLKVPDPELCLIPISGGCRVDDRTDLARSTAAAIASLGEAWKDPKLAASGSSAEMTILSHNGGYDDSRFNGKRKGFNVLPAFEDWSRGKDPSVHHTFYGSNIKCDDHHGGPKGNKFCGSELYPETQHYAYNIVAQHILAVCYYGKNYSDTEEAYAGWDTLVEDGYCTRFAIPTKTTVKTW